MLLFCYAEKIAEKNERTGFASPSIYLFPIFCPKDKRRI